MATNEELAGLGEYDGMAWQEVASELIKRIETLENDSARFFVDLNHAKISINALCDVLESLISDYIDTQYSGAGVENTDEMLFDLVKARIPTGEAQAQEAQDEPQDCEAQDNGINTPTPQEGLHTEQSQAKSEAVQGVQLGDASLSASVDAQLKALFEDFDDVLKKSRQSDFLDRVQREIPLLRLVKVVRPHLEKMAQEVECLKVELKGANERCQSLFEAKNHWADKSRMLMKVGGEYQEQNIKLNKDRDALKAQVARLRGLLMAMPHLGEMHEGYVRTVKEALAESEEATQNTSVDLNRMLTRFPHITPEKITSVFATARTLTIVLDETKLPQQICKAIENLSETLDALESEDGN